MAAAACSNSLRRHAACLRPVARRARCRAQQPSRFGGAGSDGSEAGGAEGGMLGGGGGMLGGGMSPEELQQKMRDDPEFAAQMKEQAAKYEEVMQSPEMQAAAKQQAAQMAELGEKLKDHPDFKQFFQDVKQGGQEAMMRYWKDDDFVRKFGRAMQEHQAQKAKDAEQFFEVENIFDAAKAGDVEAIEDFAATGVDLNEKGEDGRSAMHLAVAYGRMDALRALIKAGGNYDAKDPGKNTVLMYAVGYGRKDCTLALLEAGASAAAQNDKGMNALQLAMADERNPLASDQEVLDALKSAVDAAPAFSDV